MLVQSAFLRAFLTHSLTRLLDPRVAPAAVLALPFIEQRGNE